MSTFKRTSWVCLVTPEVLEAERALQKAQFRDHSTQHVLLLKPLWRRIEVTATAELVVVGMGDVNEEAALGGQCNGSFNARTLRLTWDGLTDFDALARQFEHERVCVLQAAAHLLSQAREAMAPRAQLLAA